MNRLTRLSLLACAGLFVSGCGIFGDDKDKEFELKELVEIEQTLEVSKLWSTKVGAGSEFLRLALMPAGDGKRIYAAGHDGTVSAFNPETGKRVWRTDSGGRLSAGPGVGGVRIVVGGSDGGLSCLSAGEGSEKRRRDVDGEVLGRPAIKDE